MGKGQEGQWTVWLGPAQPHTLTVPGLFVLYPRPISQNILGPHHAGVTSTYEVKSCPMIWRGEKHYCRVYSVLSSLSDSKSDQGACRRWHLARQGSRHSLTSLYHLNPSRFLSHSKLALQVPTVQPLRPLPNLADIPCPSTGHVTSFEDSGTCS